MQEPVNEKKSKNSRNYKGSFNETGQFKFLSRFRNNKNNKQSDILASQNIESKPFETFSKSPKLQKIFSEFQIKREQKIIETNN